MLSGLRGSGPLARRRRSTTRRGAAGRWRTHQKPVFGEPGASSSIVGAMPKPTKPGGPLSFPHHVGPGTRDHTSALLYHGGIGVTLPGWFNPTVLLTFLAVGQHAHKTAHPLTPLFSSALHYFDLAHEQSKSEMVSLEPLSPWVTAVVTLYPGNTEAYESWTPLHPALLPLAAMSLEDPLHLATAGVEFVWRVWELALELGASAEETSPSDVNHQGILDALQTRATQLGNGPLLFAECALNRYCMPRSGAGFYVTSSDHAVGILGAMGLLIEGEDDTAAATVARTEHLSFYLFDRILKPFIKPLHAPNVERVATLMADHAEARLRMRNHCESSAGTLIASGAIGSQLEQLVQRAFIQMSDEAQSIADVDAATLRDYLDRLSEDPKVWTAVAGLVGTSVGLPEAVAASLAVTTLSLLGAHAVAARRQKRDTLKGSPWGLVYYAKR